MLHPLDAFTESRPGVFLRSILAPWQGRLTPIMGLICSVIVAPSALVNASCRKMSICPTHSTISKGLNSAVVTSRPAHLSSPSVHHGNKMRIGEPHVGQGLVDSCRFSST